MKKFVIISILLFCFLSAVSNIIIASKSNYTTSKLSLNSPLTPIDIGVIEIDGTIVNGRDKSILGESSFTTSEKIIKLLNQAQDDNVKGIILKINSPGGTASGAQSIYNEILKIRKKGIKVITVMEDLVASGGYYIASASDYIYAYPSTLTGSIGVISYVQNIKGLFDKIGIKTTVIKSGQFKDIGSPYRDITSEEKKIFQDIVDTIYYTFIKDVSYGRRMDINKVKKLADGRIFIASKAKNLGLIDELGGYTSALDRLTILTKLKNKPNVHNYSQENIESILKKLMNLNYNPDLITNYYLKYLCNIPLMLYNPSFN